MFDAIRNNKRLVQIFLVFITVPFAVWGLDAYFQGGGDTTLATVGKTRITVSEFQKALLEQQEVWRRQAPGVDAAALNTPKVRAAMLENMVMRRIVQLEAQRLRLDMRMFLRELILNMPEFQENGEFSLERYKSALKSLNLTVQEFEAQFLENLTQQTLLGAVQDGALASQTVARHIAALQSETRVVEKSLISGQSLLGQVEVTEAEAQQFYDANTSRFTVPEQARVEYLILAQKDLEAREKPDEKTVRAWYDAHREQFALRPERRRISHIQTSSKVAAEAALAEAKQNPERFAELAKTLSEDAGSAQQGGDLADFSEHAGLVAFAGAPFADVVFSLQAGEISGVVKSEFGFHVIRLTGIEPGQYRSFAEARAEVEAALKREDAARRFADNAEKFANLVYEQFDSLKPAAEAFGLTVQQSGWLTREIDPQTEDVVLKSASLRSAMFNDETLKNGHNTQALEVAPNIIASARLLEHKPAVLTPFAELKQDILAFLRLKKGEALAVEQGKANLAELEKAGSEAAVKSLMSKLNLKWDKPQSVSRIKPGDNLPPLAIDAIFRASGAPPFYTGVELPGAGYALYRISRVTAGEITEETLAGQHQQLVRINAQNEVNAYLATLRQRYAVEINQKKLLEEENSKD